MEIRPFLKKDQLAVLQLLQSNIPAFFDESEENDFLDYLENSIEDYFVIELDGEIIGSGGINYCLEERKARISWDVIKASSHGLGIGTKLTEFRIDQLRSNSEVECIEVRTSQLAFEFYKKLGFQLISIEKDYWAKGFDLYLMSQSI